MRTKCQISLNRLATESRLGKQKLRTMLSDGVLRGDQEATGRRTIWIDRASAVEAGILDGGVSRAQPGSDGTIDAALRAVISDELGPVLTLLTERTADIDHSALIAAIDRAGTTLERIEAVLLERLPRRRKRRWRR